MIRGKPNLLNVAATRAKKHFYIVSNADSWCEVYSFDTVYGMLAQVNDPLILDQKATRLPLPSLPPDNITVST